MPTMNKYFEINEMLDRETNKTINIDFVFFKAKVGVLNVQMCKIKQLNKLKIKMPKLF